MFISRTWKSLRPQAHLNYIRYTVKGVLDWKFPIWQHENVCHYNHLNFIALGIQFGLLKLLICLYCFTTCCFAFYIRAVIFVLERGIKPNLHNVWLLHVDTDLTNYFLYFKSFSSLLYTRRRNYVDFKTLATHLLSWKFYLPGQKYKFDQWCKKS